MRRLAQGAILTAAVLVLAGAAQASLDAGEQVDFTLDRIGGGSLSLSELRDQWVVINYWATWCAPCRKEMPELSELHRQRDDITVLGLAYEDTEISEFLQFLEEIKPEYPILLVDVYAPPEPFGTPRVLPTTYILRPGGRLAKVFVGPVTREQIEQFVESNTHHG